VNRASLLRDPLPGASCITVFGLGWTGILVSNLLRRFGKRVIATDTRSPEALQAALDGLATGKGAILDPEVEIRCGQHTAHGADAVVATQALQFTAPEARAVLNANIPLVYEVEIAQRALDPAHFELVCIAGTDGKTTTTKLAHHLVSHQRRALVGGNSWTPLSGIADQAADALAGAPLPEGQKLTIIAEISAFQLPPWHRFSPRIAAVTNVAEDHIEEFFGGDLGAYIKAKRAATDWLAEGQVAVLNVDDPKVRLWENDIHARGATVVRTSLSARAIGDHPYAAYRHNGDLRLRWQGRDESLVLQRDATLVGDHNAENILTATGALLPLTLDLDGLREALSTFEAPHHRLEKVATVDGVDVFDDSKATNAHASLAGLTAFGGRPIVAIVGGVDKGLDLDQWVETLRSRARAVIVIGELRKRLLSDYRDRLPQASAADDLRQAVDAAFKAAQPGDVLVLSPACSSFDMFTGYAHRGNAFKAEVRARL
jgi:UDP-N-acetylmuramoylalanine--D-glutamate ligase